MRYDEAWCIMRVYIHEGMIYGRAYIHEGMVCDPHHIDLHSADRPIIMGRMMMNLAAVAGLPVVAFAALGVHKLHAIVSVHMFMRR